MGGVSRLPPNLRGGDEAEGKNSGGGPVSPGESGGGGTGGSGSHPAPDRGLGAGGPGGARGGSGLRAQHRGVTTSPGTGRVPAAAAGTSPVPRGRTEPCLGFPVPVAPVAPPPHPTRDPDDAVGPPRWGPARPRPWRHRLRGRNRELSLGRAAGSRHPPPAPVPVPGRGDSVQPSGHAAFAICFRRPRGHGGRIRHRHGPGACPVRGAGAWPRCWCTVPVYGAGP